MWSKLSVAALLLSLGYASEAEAAVSVYSELWEDPQAEGISYIAYAAGEDSECEGGGVVVYADLDVNGSNIFSSGSSGNGCSDMVTTPPFYQPYEGVIEGTYTATGRAYGSGGSHGCVVVNIYLSIKNTYYSNPVQDGGECIYTQLACASGVPTCAWGFGWHLKPPYSSCPQYMHRRWLVAQTVGVGTERCLFGLDSGVGGPGPCN